MRFGLMASFMRTVNAPLTPCETERSHSHNAPLGGHAHMDMPQYNDTDDKSA